MVAVQGSPCAPPYLYKSCQTRRLYGSAIHLKDINDFISTDYRNIIGFIFENREQGQTTLLLNNEKLN
jgi:hypothetical protein